MIEFKGELSENSKMRLLKDQVKIYIASMLLVYLVIGGGALIIALSCEFMFLFWTTMLAITILCVLCIIIPFVWREKELKYLIYKNIIVDTDDEYIYVTRECDNHTFSIRFDEITKIIENEEYYYIKKEFKLDGYVCQKDLITEGSIEEFEEIFNDLIVKKFE